MPQSFIMVAEECSSGRGWGNQVAADIPSITSAPEEKEQLFVMINTTIMSSLVMMMIKRTT